MDTIPQPEDNASTEAEEIIADALLAYLNGDDPASVDPLTLELGCHQRIYQNLALLAERGTKAATLNELVQAMHAIAIAPQDRDELDTIVRCYLTPPAYYEPQADGSWQHVQDGQRRDLTEAETAELERLNALKGTPPVDNTPPQLPTPAEARSTKDTAFGMAADCVWREHASILKPPGEHGDTPAAAFTRDDGHPLAYAHRVNFITGLPGEGKSWVALLACKQVLEAGGIVSYIDCEDGPAGIAQRLALLGLGGYAWGDQPTFLHFNEAVLDDMEAYNYGRLALEDHAMQGKPCLVVIDSANASGAANDGSQIEGWWDNVIKPWRSTVEQYRATIIVVDHKPKRRDHGTRGPIGSVAKLSRLDGTCLMLDGTPWTTTTGGHVNVYVEKDRLGHVGPRDKQVATIRGTWKAGAFGLTIEDPTAAAETKTATQIVLEAITETPGLTSNEVGERVSNKLNGQAYRTARRKLEADGLIESRKKTGKADYWYPTETPQEPDEISGLIDAAFLRKR